MNLCEETSPICSTRALLLCMARGEPPQTFIVMALTIAISPVKSQLVISIGDTFSRRVIWEGRKSRPVHGHIGGGELYGDAWSRAGVLFYAYHLQASTRLRGERYAIVCYTSASWARLTPSVRQGILEMGFHCGDDM